MKYPSDYRKAEERKATAPHARVVYLWDRMSQEAIEERNRRLAIPKTLTATLMGDPPPGYSALDR